MMGHRSRAEVWANDVESLVEYWGAVKVSASMIVVVGFVNGQVPSPTWSTWRRGVGPLME
jgi:hypothetical protein